MRNLIPILLALVVFLYGCQQEKCGEPVEHYGYKYSTVEIGDQCWFAENCRYLPSITPENERYFFEGMSDEDQYRELSIPRYYVSGYNGLSVDEAKQSYNYFRYGVLYNWEAATKRWRNKICPNGWHLASYSDFRILVKSIMNEDLPEISNNTINLEKTKYPFFKKDLGISLKSDSTLYYGYVDGEEVRYIHHPDDDSDWEMGINSFGFNALPGGRKWSEFYDINSFSSSDRLDWEKKRSNSWFWLDNELGEYESLALRIKDSHEVYLKVIKQPNGLACRCVRD